ncbi:MAG: c-type cytochrome [Sulfurovum sp.]
MKKNILLFTLLATILLVGCNTESDTEAKDVHVQTVQDAQEAVASLVEKAKEIKKAQEMDKVVPQEKIVEITKTEANTTVVVVNGAVIFQKCATCHGEDGKKSAFQKSEIIAGQSVENLITYINAYKAGTRDVANMGKLMKGQVSGLSEDDIQDVAEYISGL